MGRTINMWNGVCEHCKQNSKTKYLNEDGCELGICSECGSLTFKQYVNAKKFIIELLEEDITNQDSIEKLLAEEIAERMPWLEDDFIETFSSVLTGQLYDDAVFAVEAERAEAEEAYREHEEARMGAY